MRIPRLPALVTNAAPASGTASRVLARFTIAGRDILLRQTVIDPGGTSGWHFHDGTLFVLVARGTLDHPGPDGAPVTYHRGRVFREPSGPRYPHVARNLGPAAVTLFVLYLNPKGSPLSRSIPPPPGTD
ncbi:cupin domain-containing protein [Nocardia amikacinitolerans]|uniref:cupin domain-containing protein n=1 Tax=Nocardia amikacinitolerans TaxID=756689 RepID=UPI0020A2D181|nr:cupin domain-containing protein [Nocardia amikacinitolerans]